MRDGLRGGVRAVAPALSKEKGRCAKALTPKSDEYPAECFLCYADAPDCECGVVLGDVKEADGQHECAEGQIVQDNNILKCLHLSLDVEAGYEGDGAGALVYHSLSELAEFFAAGRLLLRLFHCYL